MSSAFLIYTIQFINYQNTETFETTEEHPFWIDGSGWIAASALIVGMKLVDRNNNILTVVSQTKLDKTNTVYNFEVDEFHTYHISEFGVWVHNSCFGKVNFNLNRIPANIQNSANETLSYINRGTTPPGADGNRKRKWGSTYDNRNSVRPTKDINGNNITYKEYDIPNMRDSLGAGTDRIVIGSDGRRYYTGNHYDGFARIK